MLCDAGPVSAIRQPVGPSHAQVGEITLADGTTFEVWGDDNGATFLKGLRRGDRVEICFGPSQRWADEPPEARPGFALAVRTAVTYTTVGIPGTGAVTFPPRPTRGAIRKPTAP